MTKKKDSSSNELLFFLLKQSILRLVRKTIKSKQNYEKIVIIVENRGQINEFFR